VLFGFAREADDERRAHRNAGNSLPEIVQDLEIALAVRGPQHRTQHFGVRVL
jgi:hypothetical protein